MNDQKEIKIETIKHVFEVVTPENKERFLLDFAAFLCAAVDLKQRVPDLEIFAMNWTDDGVHDALGFDLYDSDGIVLLKSYIKNKEYDENERPN